MTAQISDQFLFEKGDYSLVAQSQPLQFHPVKLGLRPIPGCTACWRGYWCVYRIGKKGIFLKDLYIHCADDHYPDINGVSVSREKDGKTLSSYMGHCVYRGLNLPLSYTGKLLIGSDFLSEHYIHMGFQRPWAYQTLKELVFEDGKLTAVNDQSEVAAELRAKLREGPEGAMTSSVEDFVDESFSLDYKNKAWWLESEDTWL